MCLFVRPTLNILFIAGLICRAQAALAAQPSFWLDEIRLGGTQAGTAEIQALFSPLPLGIKAYDRNWAWIFTPRPMIGTSVSLEGKTSELYAGLAWNIPLTSRFFVDLQAGGLVHNQDLNIDYSDRPSPLSTRVMFRESIGLGYNIDQTWRVLAFADHGSNGNLGYRNESINHFGLMVGAKLGPPDREPLLEDKPVAAFAWTGLYAGFGVGLAHSAYDLSWLGTGTGSESGNSVYGGGQVGYNWAFGRLVTGVVADYAFQQVSAATTINAQNLGFSASSFWVATARARLGLDAPIPYISPRSLIYVTGGAALTRVAANYCNTASAPCYAGPARDIAGGWVAEGTLRGGWTVGAGLEFPLANWVTAQFEYLYIDFGQFDSSYGAFADQIRFDEQVLKAEMNFKLD